jgi:hypothetical protein
LSLLLNEHKNQTLNLAVALVMNLTAAIPCATSSINMAVLIKTFTNGELREVISFLWAECVTGAGIRRTHISTKW